MTPRTRPVDLPEGYQWQVHRASDSCHFKDYVVLELCQVSKGGSHAYPVGTIEVLWYTSIRRRSKKLWRHYFKQKDKLDKKLAIIEEINR